MLSLIYFLCDYSGLGTRETNKQPLIMVPRQTVCVLSGAGRKDPPSMLVGIIQCWHSQDRLSCHCRWAEYYKRSHVLQSLNDLLPCSLWWMMYYFRRKANTYVSYFPTCSFRPSLSQGLTCKNNITQTCSPVLSTEITSQRQERRGEIEVFLHSAPGWCAGSLQI